MCFAIVLQTIQIVLWTVCSGNLKKKAEATTLGSRMGQGRGKDREMAKP